MNIALKWTRPIQPIGGHVLKALRNISISHNYQQQEGTKADGDKITRRPPKTLAFKNVPAGSGRGDDEASKKVDNISRAMAYYIKTKSERDSLMSFKSDEYEIGRRHLANIMGKDPESFTQKDIDEAIEYLLPSGLFNKKARPFFKHPEQYYPKSKIASFGNDGRPLHTLFYTGCPEFYQLIYDITQKIIDLNKLEDSMNLVKEKMKMFNKEDERLNEFSKVDLTGSKWISHADFCKKIDINIDEFNYKKFILLLQKLADHPLSKREEEFINQYKVAFEPPIKLSQIPEPSVDNEGRKYQEIETHKRTSRVIVRLYDQGTGEIRISSPDEGGEFDIKYFDMLTHREQLLFPFKVVDRVNKFDLHVKVLNGGGMSCMAKAVRNAISKALCAFISSDSIEKLRLAGLLTLDSRRRERKKAGQKGARRKFTWLKR